MLFVGLDIGTGSAKAVLLTETGQALGQGSARYDVLSPRPGWAESDPMRWWDAVGEVTRQVVAEHGADIGGIGLSGQMHGVVLTAAGGEPLRPAVLWADTRSRVELDTYHALGPETRHRLANPYVTGMAGPSLMWLKKNEPEQYARARWAMQPKDWVRLQMTGEAASDPSDASATLLYDLLADTWALDIIEALGLRGDLMPPLVPSGQIAGHLSADAASHLGLPAGIPVATGAADTPSAMLGTGLWRTGQVQLTVGTGGQIVAPLNAPVLDPSFRTHLFRAARPHAWYAMAAVQNVGLALEWVRGVLSVTWEDVYREAFSVPPGADGCLFVPYLTGERTPHMDNDARGTWTGLRLHHGRAHLLRAALEGVAFALKEGLQVLEERGIVAPDLRLAGGGTMERVWRQMLADVLNRRLLVLPDVPASARGAALLAGSACGTFTDSCLTELAPTPREVVSPGRERAPYEEAYTRYRALYPALHRAPRDT